jgi:hypothetical protein
MPLTKRDMSNCVREYEHVWTVPPTYRARQVSRCPSYSSAGGTHHYIDHRKPHRLLKPKPVCSHKGNEGTEEAAKVVDRHEESEHARPGVVDDVQKVFIIDDSGEDTLVIT